MRTIKIQFSIESESTFCFHCSILAAIIAPNTTEREWVGKNWIEVAGNDKTNENKFPQTENVCCNLG